KAPRRYAASSRDKPGRSGHLRRADPQGRQACRPASRAADHVRADHQPQDRQGARPHDPASASRTSRSGHRVIARRAFLASLTGGQLPLASALDDYNPPGGARRTERDVTITKRRKPPSPTRAPEPGSGTVAGLKVKDAGPINPPPPPPPAPAEAVTKAPVVPLYSSTWSAPMLATKRLPLDPNTRPEGAFSPPTKAVTKAPVVPLYSRTWPVKMLPTKRFPLGPNTRPL